MQSTILVGNRSTFFREGLMITPRGYAHKYHDVTGETKAGEKPGRSLSLGLAGWQAAVHRYLRARSTASLGSAARDLNMPLGDILAAIAAANATGPSNYQATPVDALQLPNVLEAVRHWGWLRAVVDNEGGARLEVLIRGDDLQQIGDELKVLHERFTLSIPWGKVAALWLVTEFDGGYGAYFLDDRKEPVCELWLASDERGGNAIARTHFLELRDRLVAASRKPRQGEPPC
jgi:precorrin-3B C17-methyltransferase